MKDYWWKAHGDKQGDGTWKCRYCEVSMSPQRGKFGRHVKGAHPEALGEPAKEPAPAPAPDPEKQVEALGKGLEGTSREESLKALLELAEGEGTASNVRVQARQLIMKAMGHLDLLPEEDFEKKEERWQESQLQALQKVQRVRDALVKEARRPEVLGFLRTLLPADSSPPPA